ncbi:hypothetical protein BDBG_09358 [Blastomyces gilchristii SLH14081]|uniref:Uncharacterized protein n=1 Tax=Blastomyces gilchristii (strain SLH14081) TaxID=559298 RepID=A0A179V4E6_BLAGS|nr:uncharacterized protein BDBG_09358 [Blastomyces gilchristii SLH14081]OAT14297.1 hypothetical protein BDBG_09358 [Blastomyces gilchristii SLH14081]
MEGPNGEIEWERERLGPELMDGTPFLSPHQHPLWKGFMDTHEITAQRFPPSNRTLILEQYKVLERLTEETGESSTPYKAEKAKHIEVNLHEPTYYCNGRPQIDMPDRMRDVFLEYEWKVPMTMEEDNALVKEIKHLKGEERRLKGVIKVLEEDKEAMQVQWNEICRRVLRRTIDDYLDDSQHILKHGPSPAQTQPAAKKLKAEKSFEQTSVATTPNISPADRSRSLLAMVLERGLSAAGEKPLHLSSGLLTKGAPEKRLKARVAFKAGVNPKQSKSLITDSRHSVTNTPIGSSPPKSSGKARQFVLGQPDFTGTMALSHKLHPHLYSLARKSKYFALMKFGVVPPKRGIVTSPEYSQAERFFTLILWRNEVTFFRDPGYANGDAVPLTQTALGETTLSELCNITLGHLAQRNPAIKQKQLQSAIREPFQYTSIRELADDLIKKRLRCSSENLAQKPLEEQNGDINSEAVADILAKQESTFRELTDLFKKYDSVMLAKALYNYEATSCG